MFSGVFFEGVAPFTLTLIIMFSLCYNIVHRFKTKLILYIGFFTILIIPYTLAYYIYEGSPRLITFIIGFIVSFLYSFCYVRKLLKYSVKQYFQKIKYPLLLITSCLLHLTIITWIFPYIYKQILRFASRSHTNNFFQIIVLVYINFYEPWYSYIFLKYSRLLIMHGNLKKDFSLIIFATKYYFTTFYSIRLGNILYLDSNDWAIYLHFVSFGMFVYENCTGVSLVSEYIFEPLKKKFIKSKKKHISLIFSISKHSFDKEIKPYPTKICNMLHSSRLFFMNKKQYAKQKTYMIINYQKLDFFFIYIPSIVYLWLRNTWKSVEPFYG